MKAICAEVPFNFMLGLRYAKLDLQHRKHLSASLAAVTWCLKETMHVRINWSGIRTEVDCKIVKVESRAVLLFCLAYGGAGGGLQWLRWLKISLKAHF